VTKLKEAKLRAADFAPQFSVKHMSKDMRLAAAMAAGADYPILQTVRIRLAVAEERGMGDDDFSALIRLL